MDNNSHFVVGLDIGTENVRSVVLNVDKDSLNVVGYGEIKNNGMRKGIVADLTGPAEAIDKMLGELGERLKGQYYSVKFTDELRKWVLDSSYSPIFGARPIKRFIQDKVETALATAIIKGEIDTKHEFVADINAKNEVVVRQENRLSSQA